MVSDASSCLIILYRSLACLRVSQLGNDRLSFTLTPTPACPILRLNTRIPHLVSSILCLFCLLLHIPLVSFLFSVLSVVSAVCTPIVCPIACWRVSNLFHCIFPCLYVCFSHGSYKTALIRVLVRGQETAS